MERPAYLAMVAMLNGFPQTGGNPDLTMGTYEKVLDDLLPEAIIEAARRYTQGEVKDQSLTFAPSVAEFVQEARRRQEYLELKARPRLPPPVYQRGPLMPFELRKQKAFSEHAHLPVLFEDVSLEQFKRLSHERQLPTGASFVACLGVIYGPEPRKAAAE